LVSKSVYGCIIVELDDLNGHFYEMIMSIYLSMDL